MYFDWDDWFKKPGRFQGEEAADKAFLRALKGGGRSSSGRYGMVTRRGAAQPVTRKAGQRSRARDAGSGRTSFHLAHSYITKHRQGPKHDLPALQKRYPDRIYLSGGGRQRAALKQLGATWDRQSKRYYVARAAFAGRGHELSRYQGAKAERGHDIRQKGGRYGRDAGTARAHQEYIERAYLEGEEYLREVVHDAAGPISMGSIGETVRERQHFWDRVEENETFDGARVQLRWIAEIPHELRPSLVREAMTQIGAILGERGLPWWGVAHHPDVEKGSDPRNIHGHIVYLDRAVERRGPEDWVFAPKKDREAQGDAWIAGFRERFCSILNDALARESALLVAEGQSMIERRYDPRSYAERGIDVVPGRHLGARRSALERAGIPTGLGAEMGAEARQEEIEERMAMLRQAEAAARVMLRPVAAKGPATASGMRRVLAAEAVLDQVEEIMARQGDMPDAGVERIQQRLGFVEGEIIKKTMRIERLSQQLGDPDLTPAKRQHIERQIAAAGEQKAALEIVAADLKPLRAASGEDGVLGTFDALAAARRRAVEAWARVQAAAREEATMVRVVELRNMRLVERLFTEALAGSTEAAGQIATLERRRLTDRELRQRLNQVVAAIQDRLSVAERRPALDAAVRAEGLERPLGLSGGPVRNTTGAASKRVAAAPQDTGLAKDAAALAKETGAGKAKPDSAKPDGGKPPSPRKPRKRGIEM